MSHMNPLTSIIEVETAWKGEELRDACVALVQAGMTELAEGRSYFGPDNIPAEKTFSGQGIMGSAVHMLREAHIIADCPVHRPSLGIWHGRRRSLRASANGRKVCLYRLVNMRIAELFLIRNGKPAPARQGELAI